MVKSYTVLHPEGLEVKIKTSSDGLEIIGDGLYSKRDSIDQDHGTIFEFINGDVFVLKKLSEEECLYLDVENIYNEMTTDALRIEYNPKNEEGYIYTMYNTNNKIVRSMRYDQFSILKGKGLIEKSDESEGYIEIYYSVDPPHGDQY